jgi:hypothetical protein
MKLTRPLLIDTKPPSRIFNASSKSLRRACSIVTADRKMIRYCRHRYLMRRFISWRSAALNGVSRRVVLLGAIEPLPVPLT